MPPPFLFGDEMLYKLSNGKEVNLATNTDVAKFIYLVMPYKNLYFVEDKPKLVITDLVTQIIQHAETVRRIVRKREMDNFDWDKIPF